MKAVRAPGTRLANLLLPLSAFLPLGKQTRARCHILSTTCWTGRAGPDCPSSSQWSGGLAPATQRMASFNPGFICILTGQGLEHPVPGFAPPVSSSAQFHAHPDLTQSVVHVAAKILTALGVLGSKLESARSFVYKMGQSG